jgi:hypothetical protein
MSSGRAQRIEAGAMAAREGKPVTTLPYANHTQSADDWLHGWWGAFYQQQKEDETKIANWLNCYVSMIYSETQAKALAEIIVRSRHYDRTKPIEDNRIAGEVFAVPAPETLK